MSRPFKLWSQRFPLEVSDSRLARSVFLLLFALYVATFNGLPGGIDGEVSFQTTSALARTGSLSLGGTPEAQRLIEHGRSVPPGAFSVRHVKVGEREGDYAWFGIGNAITGLPFYVLGKVVAWMSPRTEAAHRQTTRFGSARSEYYEHLFVGLRNPLLGALTACLLVLIARRLGVFRRASFLAGLGYGLCTFALPQARGWSSEVQAAFCLCAAFYGLLVLRGRLTTKGCVLFGAALGLAFLTRVSLLPVVLVLDLALLWLVNELRRASPASGPVLKWQRALLAAALPQILAALMWLIANGLRFGDVLESGYGPALEGGLFGGDPRRALQGLLISPSKGLLWMAPGVLLVWLGLRRAKEERELCLALILGLCSLAVLLPAVFMVGWHGAWTWGPRYLLPALPLLWVLALLGFQRSAVDARLRPLALALLAMGLLTQVPGVLVDTMTYHDLASQAAPARFQVAAEGTEADQAEARFQAMQFDWGFAAPWAHWRILRHRVALSQEFFPSAEIFRYSTEQVLEPSQPRERGFRHMAWVDLRQRLGGNVWAAVAAIVVMLLLGTADAVRGLDP